MNTEFYCDPAYSGCGALPNEPCKEDCTKANAAREHVLSRLAEPHTTKTPPQVYTATLYRFPTKRLPGEIPLMWASAAIGAQYMASGMSSSHWLNVRQGPAYARYVLNISHPRADIMPGWLQIRVRLEIDTINLGDDVIEYPVNIYDADVTDINTGLVKFPPMPIWDHRSRDNQASDGVVWMLGMRRSI